MKYYIDDYEHDDFNILDNSLISICCGVPKILDSDICYKCKEHTTFEKNINENKYGKK